MAESPLRLPFRPIFMLLLRDIYSGARGGSRTRMNLRSTDFSAKRIRLWRKVRCVCHFGVCDKKSGARGGSRTRMTLRSTDFSAKRIRLWRKVRCVCHFGVCYEKSGARGGSRTRMNLRSTDFKSVASAISPPGHLILNCHLCLGGFFRKRIRLWRKVRCVCHFATRALEFEGRRMEK